MHGFKVMRTCALSLAALFAAYSFADAGILCKPRPLPGNVGNVAGLKLCINNANKLAGGTIDLGGLLYVVTAPDNTVDGPNGLPDITSNIVIRNGIIVRSSATPFRLLHVSAPGSLSLINLSMQSGSDTSGIGGGAIMMAANAILGLIKDSHFTNNESNNVGGALYCAPNSVCNVITASAFSNNKAQTGGAIAVVGSSLSKVNEVLLSGNTATTTSGGAIAITDAGSITTIIASSFTNNQGANYGGAIELENGSSIDFIDSSTFAFNNAINGGAINVDLVAASTIKKIYNSTFNDNTATIGGALKLNLGSITSMANNTFNQNVAIRQGGAIFIGASASISDLFNSTIDGNIAAAASGGGIYNCGTITGMISTIAAENVGGLPGPANEDDVNNCGGTGSIGGTSSYNLIGSNANNSFVDGANHNKVGSPADPLDPDLGVLRDNGGRTFTMALLTNSPAIGAGNNPLGLVHDQRGRGFRRMVNGLTDIGAFEVQLQRECICPPHGDCRPGDCQPVEFPSPRGRGK